MLKKLTALMLVAIMLVSAFAACTADLPEVDTDGIIETTEKIIESIFGTDSETDDPNKLVIANSEEYVYTVVVSRDLDTVDRMVVRNKISQLFMDYDIKFDYRVEGEYDKIAPEANEILVGRTAREESRAAYETIKAGEYIVDYNETTGRISVAGTTSELVLEAFNYLIDTHVNTSKKTVAIPADLYYSVRRDYPLLSVELEGVDIINYTVVIPSKNDIYAYYTAQNIADYFIVNLGVQLRIVEQTEAETEYEILVGETNRDESATSVSFDVGQYLYAMKGTKLVLRGYEVYVAAGMGRIFSENFLSDGNDREIDITSIPTDETVRAYVAPKKAENVILMIGDGMGYNHINATLNSGLKSFAAQSFISVGEAITRSQSVINGSASYTDSAAAATALATGYNTLNGHIGKDAKGNNVMNVRELAHTYGAKTAVITTDVITGATPSGFLAHNISRNNTDKLQSDINKLIEDGKIEYCEGSVDDKLTIHTRKALQTIGYSDDPFFMMVEEGYIDKRSHDNNMTSMIDKVERFNDAIIFAATFTLMHPDTVLIITADHETGGLVENSDSSVGYEFTTENHTNANVPIYAIGAGCEVFDGALIENTEIAKFMAAHYGAESFGAVVA